MLFINRLVMTGLLCVGIAAATTAQAGNQMFEASWTVNAFGNECDAKSTPTPNQPCFGQATTGPSEFYSAWRIPQGVQCNNFWPRCPFQSTPTLAGVFHPIGGTGLPKTSIPANCAPWYNFQGGTTGNGAKTATMRPGKGGTVLTGMKNNPIPPLYRNYAFFTATTPAAMPNATYCNGTSTAGGGRPAATTSNGMTPPLPYLGPGKIQKGQPIVGTWTAQTMTLGKGDFSFPAAPVKHKAGLRTGQGTRTTTTVPGSPPIINRNQGTARSGARGDFQNIYPYVYSYTYATLRNDEGSFGAGAGPGNFHATYEGGKATIDIKQRAGSAKFGGTMRMLGAYTAKVCYFRQKACSVGTNNWRYDAIGASANYTTTVNGGTGTMIASGFEAKYAVTYYHTGLNQTSMIDVTGERFPWTTGSVTLKATGRGPHKTLHYTRGYDNRNPLTGKGTIQLVTPVLTRWLQPCCKWETGGVGVLRIKFVPEPQTWAILVAGVSLLGVGYRMRGR